MRVVAGELRGRRLVAPPGVDTRPTTDKVREAVFNALGSLDVVIDAHVLDLFAGTGALGIEALSRGAAHATFVESRRPALRALYANIEALGVDDRVTVYEADASKPDRVRLRQRSRLDRDVSADTSEESGPGVVVFADPPYDFDGWDELFGTLASLEPAPFLVAESGSELHPDAPWSVIRSRRYGRTWVTFCTIEEK